MARAAGWCARRLPGRLTVALAALPLVGACYVYRPMTAVEPHPGMRVAVDLNAQGRAALGTSVGSDVVRVEGALVSVAGGEYVIQVSEVFGPHGARTKWTGEAVTFRGEYMQRIREKELSRGRTAWLVGSVVGAMVTLAASTDLIGSGSSVEGKGDGGPGSDQ